MNLINHQTIFQNLLEEFGLSHYSEQILQECYFSYYLLLKKADKDIAKSTQIQIKSQFGGSPIVPKDFI